MPEVTAGALGVRDCGAAIARAAIVTCAGAARTAAGVVLATSEMTVAIIMKMRLIRFNVRVCGRMMCLLVCVALRSQQIGNG